MTRFSANLTMLFNEVPFLERFELAANAGFEAVEFLFPYAHSVAEIKKQLEQHDLKLVLHNLPAGDWEKGERGIACLPDRTVEFREGVSRTIEYAIGLGVKQVNCLIGKVPAHADIHEVDATVISNLSFAAKALSMAGIRLLIEPINTFDIPGFYLNRTHQALALIDSVGSDNLWIQYDIYHAQRMEGEIAQTLSKHLSRISHIQLADNPGRHEPGTGEINYPFLFNHLDDLGYKGWIGCEYKPLGTTQEGLHWLEGLTV
jgi:hydroxypyruvate isomerase